MNTSRFLFLSGLACSLTAGVFAQTGFAPANFGGTLFRGTLTSAAGGANGNGTFTSLFTSGGQDLTVTSTGALTDPAAYTYVRTAANTATITETLPNNQTLTVNLTYNAANAGTFAANYGGGRTQAGTFTTSSVPAVAPLLNMSTRGTLAANEPMIAGLVIGGTGPRRILMRAVGAGLSAFGVSNGLANPNLTVFAGSTSVATNDDVGQGTGSATLAEIQQAASSVGAFALAANSRDSVILATLNPGNYTAVVRGSTATEAGEVLLETYIIE